MTAPATTPASRSTTARSRSAPRDCLTIARLPVALGHRLVLVLGRVRRAEPARPPAVAAPLPAQRRLPPAGRAREPLRRRRPHRPLARAARRERVVQDVEIPVEQHGRVPALVRRQRRRCRRSGCARCGCATARAAVAAVPAAAGRELRQRRLLGHRADRAGRARRRRQPGDRGRGAPSSTGTSRSTPTRTTTGQTFDQLYGGEAYRRGQGQLRPGPPTDRPVREGGGTHDDRSRT